MVKIRWQTIAFVLSVVLFGVALLVRLNTLAPVPPPPTNSNTGVAPTSQPSAIPPEVLIIPAQAPTQTSSSDDVPTFREAVIGTVQRLNPLYASLNPVDSDITSLIFEGMFRINRFGEPSPVLAKQAIVSNDGTEYVILLREDIVWQDGIPFSADDVVYTVSLMHDSRFDGQPELGAFWRTIETEKLSPYAIRFRLTQPLSSFLSNLTFGILPEHALRGTTALELASHPFNLSPIGTGAYQLESLASSDGINISEVSLRVSPTYRQRPEGQRGYSIERLRFISFSSAEEALNALKAGQVNGYAPSATAERLSMTSLPNIETYTTFAPSVGILIYNWREGDETRFFQELRARVALQRGLNRVNPVELNLANQAVVADSPLLPNSWAYDSTLAYPTTDPIQALQLLLSANIRTPNVNPDEGKSAENATEIYAFSILTPEIPALVGLAREIATQWSQLRLTVTVESIPLADYQARLEAGDFQVAIVELDLTADPDVFAYWHAGQVPPNGKNYGSLSDDRLSELLERGRREPFDINRVALYQRIQNAFLERALAIPLYYPLFTYAVENRITGVQVGFISTPSDRFQTIGDWQLQP